MTTITAKQSAQTIAAEIKKHIKSAGTLQAAIQKTMIKIAIHGYIFKDANIVATSLNSLMEVNGSVRVNAIAYWFNNIAGFKAVYNEKTAAFSCKFAESDTTSEVEGFPPFTYDAAHVALLKVEKYSFWKVAPKDVKALTIFDDVKKVTAGIESQFARALLLGTITPEQIQEHIDGLMERVNVAKASKSTKEWVKKFQEQHSPYEPAIEEVDEVDAAIFEEGL